MKIKLKKIIIGCLISLPIISNAQWNYALLPDIRTQMTTRSVGIGTFTPFNRPKANLHVNQLLMPNSPFFATGSIFRTDGSNTVPNSWSMFTGATTGTTTEKFILFNPASSNDMVLQTTQNGAMKFNTFGINRMLLSATGEVIINDLECSDCLVMSKENGQLYADNQLIKKLEDRIKQLEQKLLEIENLLANQQ